MREFTLELALSKLGENTENIRFLGEGMKHFPKKLKIFNLNLWHNNLEGNMMYLVDGIK